MASRARTVAKAVFVLIVLFLIKNQQSRFDNHSVKNYLTDVREQSDNKILSLAPKPTKKTIQWFDIFHQQHGLRNSKNHVKIEECEFSNCILLEDYIVPDNDTRVEGPLSADAVIFQGIHVKNFLPSMRRDDKQVFVYAERETGRWMPKNVFNGKETSPTQATSTTVKQDDHYFPFASVFNWTMTYREDSDIFMPYGEIVSRQEAYERGYIQDLNAAEIKDYDQIYYNKTRDVVWLVSDCSTKSKRELYVKKLRRHISVDIYGACGSLSCPKHDNNCIDDIIRRYKFILSFENTFHKGYVTEKLFSWFLRDIVQVVYGMANYESITPSGSVINANDFHSPEELAVFMKLVGSDKHRYVEYLQIKDRYYVIGQKEEYQLAYCKLCEKLNDVDSNRRTYPDIALWWQLNNTDAFMNLYSQALA